MTGRVTWLVLGRWAREVLEGRTLEQEERRLCIEYPGHVKAIAEAFELGRMQLAALAALPEPDPVGFLLDLWRFFREPVECKTD